MTIAVTLGKDGTIVTTMTGLVIDQVALHGLLARIGDLGLPLLEVQCLDEQGPSISCMAITRNTCVTNFLWR